MPSHGGQRAAALLAWAAAFGWGGDGASQEPPPGAAYSLASGAAPLAKRQDVESLDAILAALYDVISGPAGAEQDWDRFRSLFLPEARLIPAGSGQDGRPSYRVWSVEDYIAQAGPFLVERGFHEGEIGRVTERFGNVAHVFTAYESRWTLEDPEPFQRGINSVQLYHDGDRWWIATILWDWERPGNPLPERYLESGG